MDNDDEDLNYNPESKNSKQVLIVRADLKMNKGKIASQCAHASLKVFLDRGNMHDYENNYIDGVYIPLTEGMYDWVTGSFTKVVCKVNSEQELLDLYNSAKDKNIPCSLIKDSGRTCFDGIATYTVVAIGPDFNEIIDNLTRHLPLLS